MNKLSIVLIVLALVGCSKETQFTNSAVSPTHKAELSTTNSFKIGEVNNDGSLSITYDLVELGELCACAVSESSANSLTLVEIANVGYYLEGVGTSVTSTTSFGIELSTLGSDLMWDEGAHIAQCQNNTAVPCDLDILGSEAFDCTGSSSTGACASYEIGGNSNVVYPDCEFTNWPWATKELDEDEEDDQD